MITKNMTSKFVSKLNSNPDKIAKDLITWLKELCNDTPDKVFFNLGNELKLFGVTKYHCDETMVIAKDLYENESMCLFCAVRCSLDNTFHKLRKMTLRIKVVS